MSVEGFGEYEVMEKESFPIASLMTKEKFSEEELLLFIERTKHPIQLLLDIQKTEISLGYASGTLANKLCFILQNTSFDRRDTTIQHAVSVFVKENFEKDFGDDRLALYDYVSQRSVYRKRSLQPIFLSNIEKQKKYSEKMLQFRENFKILEKQYKFQRKLFWNDEKSYGGADYHDFYDFYEYLNTSGKTIDELYGELKAESAKKYPKDYYLDQYKYETVSFKEASKIINLLQKQVEQWEKTVETDDFSKPQGRESFESLYRERVQRLKEYISCMTQILVDVSNRGQQDNFLFIIALSEYFDNYTTATGNGYGGNTLYNPKTKQGVPNSNLSKDHMNRYFFLGSRKESFDRTTGRIMTDPSKRERTDYYIRGSDIYHIDFISDVEYLYEHPGVTSVPENDIKVEKHGQNIEHHTGTIYYTAVDIRKRPINNEMLCRQTYQIELYPKNVLKPKLEVYPSFEQQNKMSSIDVIDGYYGILPNKVLRNEEEKIYEIYFGNDRKVSFPKETTGYTGTRLNWIESAKEKVYKSKAGNGLQTLGYDVSYESPKSLEPLNKNLESMSLVWTGEINKIHPSLRAKTSLYTIKTKSGGEKQMLILEDINKKLYCKEVPSKEQALLFEAKHYQTTGFNGNALYPNKLLFENTSGVSFFQRHGRQSFDSCLEKILVE